MDMDRREAILGIGALLLTPLLPSLPGCATTTREEQTISSLEYTPTSEERLALNQIIFALRAHTIAQYNKHIVGATHRIRHAPNAQDAANNLLYVLSEHGMGDTFQEVVDWKAPKTLVDYFAQHKLLFREFRLTAAVPKGFELRKIDSETPNGVTLFGEEIEFTERVLGEAYVPNALDYIIKLNPLAPHTGIRGCNTDARYIDLILPNDKETALDYWENMQGDAPALEKLLERDFPFEKVFREGYGETTLYEERERNRMISFFGGLSKLLQYRGIRDQLSSAKSLEEFRKVAIPVFREHTRNHEAWHVYDRSQPKEPLQERWNIQVMHFEVRTILASIAHSDQPHGILGECATHVLDSYLAKRQTFPHYNAAARKVLDNLSKSIGKRPGEFPSIKPNPFDSSYEKEAILMQLPNMPPERIQAAAEHTFDDLYKERTMSQIIDEELALGK